MLLASRTHRALHFLACSFVALFCVASHAQTQSKDQSKDQQNILELPEFVITGQGSLGIQSMRKLGVKDVWGFDPASRALLAPVVGNVRGAAAPDTIGAARTRGAGALFAHAQFGMYRTPEGWLQFDGASAPFDWQLRVAGSATQGSSDNAAASSVRFGGRAGWRVPDDVVTVGNARVGADVDIASTANNLYGSPTPQQERTLTTRRVEIGMTQDLGTMPFAFSFNGGSGVATDTLQKSDVFFGFDAHGAIVAPHWTVRGMAHVIGYHAPVSQRNFSVLDFAADYTVAPFRYSFGVGLFTAQNTMFASQLELGPHASAALTLGGVELFGDVARRIRDVPIAAIVRESPFVDLASLDSLRFPVEQINARVGVRTSDARMLVAETHLAYIRTASLPVYAPAPNGRWTIVYDDASTLEWAAEAGWRALPRTGVIVGGALRSTSLASTNAPIPFLPAAEASVAVEQTFTFPLDVTATLSIAGRRTGAPDGSAAIPAITLLNLDASYELFPKFSLTLQGRNLLDTRYEVWAGYPGMRAFLAAGASLQL